MNSTTSRDGTKIVYEKLGNGPSLILVDGAFCSRSFGPMKALAALLAERFTVFHYDRRGRGDSGNTAPYSVDKEIEDLGAIFEVAGGSAFLYGISSGAALAIRGVASGLKAKKLLVYEPPFALDGTHYPNPADFREQTDALLAAGNPGGAVKLFMKVVGVPAFGIFFMRLMPNVWPKLRAAATTLPHDFAILGDTQSGGSLPEELREKLASIAIPTLAAAGGKSPAWMTHAAKKVAETVPGATFEVVPGQDHNVAAKAIAPLLVDYFGS